MRAYGNNTNPEDHRLDLKKSKLFTSHCESSSSSNQSTTQKPKTKVVVEDRSIEVIAPAATRPASAPTASCKPFITIAKRSHSEEPPNNTTFKPVNTRHRSQPKRPPIFPKDLMHRLLSGKTPTPTRRRSPESEQLKPVNESPQMKRYRASTNQSPPPPIHRNSARVTGKRRNPFDPDIAIRKQKGLPDAKRLNQTVPMDDLSADLTSLHI